MIRQGRTLPIVFLSAHGTIDIAVDTMQKGAVAFVEKTADRSRLISAVNKALENEMHKLSIAPADLVAKWKSLTPRERDVALLIAQGLLNRDVGERLGGISIKTVQVHRSEGLPQARRARRNRHFAGRARHHRAWRGAMTQRRTALLGALPLLYGASDEEEVFDEQWDVVVIGSGVAGLSAAVEARKSGASVLVLEKMGSIGGNSVLSDGQVAVPGTAMQKYLGIKDSPELFAKDLRRLGRINHPWRVETLARNAKDAFEWTQTEFGVRWLKDRVEYDFDQSLSRCALLEGGSSMALVYPMADRAKNLGVELRVHHRVIRLIQGAGVQNQPPRHRRAREDYRRCTRREGSKDQGAVRCRRVLGRVRSRHRHAADAELALVRTCGHHDAARKHE